MSIEALGRSNEQFDSLLSQVFALAKDNSRSLNFLTFMGFEDRVDAGTLLIDVRDGVVVGYTIYDRSRGGLRLVQMCVRAGFRGKGIADGLLARVISDNPLAVGIKANTRRDWKAAAALWARNGFNPQSEKPGRSKSGSTITIWWRSLTTNDLFEVLAAGQQRPLVVLDTNIVLDLHSPSHARRNAHEDSQLLISPLVQDDVLLAYSPQVWHELNRYDNDAEREGLRRALGSYLVLTTTRPSDHTLEDEFLASIPREVLIDDLSLLDDVLQVADAARNGAAFFISRDANVQRYLGPEAAKRNTRIVAPYELIQALGDQGDRSYFPAELAATAYEITRPTDLAGDHLRDRFMDFPGGEKGSAFDARVRRVLSDKPATITETVSLHDGDALAIFSWSLVGPELVVALLRVRRNHMTHTLALQLARHLRGIAVSHDLPRVRISDPNIGSVTAAALTQDGYVVESGNFVATVVVGIFQVGKPVASGTPVELSAAIREGGISPETVAQLETRFWPAVLVDDDCSGYVAPIKPKWAVDLFGYPQGLIERNARLGLSRRHVYYRSGRTNPITSVPSRILWYVSGRGEVFAHSRVISSHLVTAGQAHEDNARFGIYSQQDVADAADSSGRVNVLEIEDTVLLERPVGLKIFREMRERSGDNRAEILTLRPIPATLLMEVLTYGG